MAKSLTACDLITTSLRRGLIPTDQATFTCCDLFDIMNEEMSIHIVPLVLRAHEEYYVVEEAACVCACVINYKIPYRAIGNKLRDVHFMNSSGNRIPMTRLSVEDRAFCQNSLSIDYSTYIPFDIQNDEVVLFCNPIATGALRHVIFLRPNQLVKNNRGARISAICVGACNTVFTLCTVPCHFSCTTVYDIIQGKSPNKILTYDSCYTSLCVSAKTITFANSQLKRPDPKALSTISITFNVGDYIMKAEETVYPQAPAELHPILAQRTTVKLLEALGDTEGMQNAQKELERMEYNAMTLIDNRVEGSPQKIRTNNSILRQTVGNKRGW